MLQDAAHEHAHVLLPPSTSCILIVGFLLIACRALMDDSGQLGSSMRYRAQRWCDAASSSAAAPPRAWSYVDMVQALAPARKRKRAVALERA